MSGLLLIVGFVLTLGVCLADAQEPAQPSREAASAPVWNTKCVSAARRENLDCSVEQQVVLVKTGQQLLSVVVRIPPDSRQPAMMIHLPLGLFLPAGVTIQLDQQKPERLEVQTCDLKGCYAGSAVSDKMLAAMKDGERLTITFEDLPKNKISVPVPLKGFAAAYQKIQ
jgi:invasion protein IalB